MTVTADSKRWILVLPPSLSNCQEKIELFTLPHPSNIESKKRLQLVEFKGHGIHELRSHQFSKSCSYNEDQDQLEGRYHYTKDAQAIKSTLITNGTDPQDGYVMEHGDFKYFIKYDITFNLIGFFYRDFVVKDEKDYLKEGDKDTACQSQDRFLGWRDYQDLLIDTHDVEWGHISPKSLESSLKNVAESIEEGGDLYYKITPEKITCCLVRKVYQILESFASTLPLPVSLPSNIVPYAKVCAAVNLLISLVPRPAYCNLIKYSGQDLNILEAFQNYQEYKKYLKDLSKEKELLVQNAMSVGLSTDSGAEALKKVVKKTSVKKKVAMGKGAIDGFFKKAK